ncbi:MAG: hypothetical protein KDC49_21315 [Saprospiraceae bacterium]|nr:hypothetical protein [Saprospiraceae bacterium]
MTTKKPTTSEKRGIHTILILFFCQFAFAQITTTEIDVSPALDKLTGYIQTIYFSPGQDQRAKSIADLMENAAEFFQQEIGFTPKTNMFVLSPNHWKAFAAPPLRETYGFPHNADKEKLVIAAEDNDFWRSFLPQVDKLPDHLALEVRKAYGKEDGSYSMMPFFDLLALHEMGHSYTSQAGLRMHRNWMSELFVNIMLHTFIAEKQNERLPALQTFPNMVIGAGSSDYKYTNLADFEALYPTLGMGPKNYGWYQCRLHSAAKDVYNNGGKAVLQKLWKAMLKHQEDMTDEELIDMLENEVHPSVAQVFQNWDKTP